MEPTASAERELGRGAVLCDRKMPVKLTEKIYRKVVRPALLYGAETRATKKGQEGDWR